MENTDLLPNRDALLKEIDGYRKHSYIRALCFGAFYYCLRSALIVLSACAAAKSLDGMNRLAAYAPLFSLLVAIGTSIDTWLKTGVTYRGHYLFNDKFIALKTDLQLTPKGDTVGIEQINKSFKKMVEDYAAAVLPM